MKLSRPSSGALLILYIHLCGCVSLEHQMFAVFDESRIPNCAAHLPVPTLYSNLFPFFFPPHHTPDLLPAILFRWLEPSSATCLLTDRSKTALVQETLTDPSQLRRGATATAGCMRNRIRDRIHVIDHGGTLHHRDGSHLRMVNHRLGTDSLRWRIC